MGDYRLTIEYKDGTTYSSPDYVYVINLANDTKDRVARFVLIKNDKEYALKTDGLPESFRFIHALERSLKVIYFWENGKRWVRQEPSRGRTIFGYQYNDASGRNHKVTKWL